jgi:catechol 2,3-dioxygenase-like lactoylglutathione lyase family enzyme
MPDKVEHLVNLYDGGAIGRRQLLQGLLALGVCGTAAAGQTLGAPSSEPLLRARTINHVTLYTRDVARSKAFYRRLAGLPIRDEAKDFCEFRLEGGFLGLYAPEAERRPGFDHFCLGIEGYNAKRVHATLTQAVPESQPSLENEDQVYVRDPDGVRVQFADVTYKR